jgi:hypothetical protein
LPPETPSGTAYDFFFTGVGFADPCEACYAAASFAFSRFSHKVKNKVKNFPLFVAFLPKFPLASLQRVCYK